MKPTWKLPTAIATTLAVATGGCADGPTRPSTLEEGIVALDVTAEQRAQMGYALVFARDRLGLALEQREAADRVASAFASAVQSIERNDRARVERAIQAARDAITRYAEAVRDDAGAAELEAMSLTLDRIAALASGREERSATNVNTTSKREDAQQ